MKKLIWKWVAKGFLGNILLLFGPFLRQREKLLGLRNPLHMKFITTEQGGNLYVSEFENHISLGSASGKLIRFDPDQFEDDVSFLFDRLVKKSDTVLDIGANNGFHTVLFSKKASNGRVFAFEPLRKFAQQASLNCALNGANNVKIVSCALGAKDENLDMKVNIGGVGLQGTSTFIDNNKHVGENPGFYETQSMPVRRLDGIINKIGISDKVNFMKIDTEGFDTMVLEGAMRTIQTYRPVMFVEAHTTRLIEAGKSWAWYIDTFPDYHILVMYPTTRAKPYLHLEPLTPDLPIISVNLLMLPKCPNLAFDK
ncbi:MAG: hypothetical protein CMF69_06560 [Magnetovibrio sp.]|nr:hypothetical protein [Magnetovibrio sp.]|tara:strand:- start:1408 stop:2340 length:933 start_codon:yes stop_codon:yes gene_type:complete